jgi:multiple sugar transport system permease protein
MAESAVPVVRDVAAERAAAARRRRRRLKENLIGWLFAAPWVFGLLAFVVGPMVASIYLGMTRYDVIQPPVWVGLRNYTEILTEDPLTWQSLRFTTVYAVLSVSINLVAGLLLAILLNQRIRWMPLWRTLYYMPTLLSGVVVALLWLWMFNGHFGVVNYLLRALLGVQGPNWLLDERWVLPGFLLLSLWGIGGAMLINLGGLQGVPTALHEAAEIDGANAVRRFWHITIPMISPVILFNLILGVIGALQSFTYFFIMTKGGPNDATLSYTLYLYRQAFDFLHMGYAAAMAWILFVYLAGLTLLMFRLSRGWVYYEYAKPR